MQRFALFTALAISLVVAAGTSTAIGSTRPDDRANHGTGAAALQLRSDVVRPDDRATHGPGAAELQLRSDVTRPDDRANHGTGAIVLEQVTPAGQTGESEAARIGGFDWLDAGIGAAAAFGLGLIAAGGVVLARRRPRSPAYS